MAGGPPVSGWGSSVAEMAGVLPVPGWDAGSQKRRWGSTVAWVGNLVDHNGWGSTGVWVGKLVDRNGWGFNHRLSGEPR